MLGRMVSLRSLRWLIGSLVKARVEGSEHLPVEGAAILTGNHPNLLDGIILAVVCPRPVRILVAGELFSSPLVARFLDGLGWIPVDRRGGGNAAAVEQALAALEAGELVVVFPEGKTDYGRELLEFKPGVALLALRSGAPVIPFGIEGSQHLYPDGSPVFHSGRVNLVFGEPVRFEPIGGHLSDDLVRSALEGLRERVCRLWEQARAWPAGRGGVAAALLPALAARALSLMLLTVRWR